jgi:hypothetical protein
MELLKQATLLLSVGVEAATALVSGLAAIEATVRALLLFLPGRMVASEPDAKEAVRLRLGRWLTGHGTRAGTRGRHPANRAGSHLNRDRTAECHRRVKHGAQLLPATEISKAEVRRNGVLAVKP